MQNRKKSWIQSETAGGKTDKDTTKMEFSQQIRELQEWACKENKRKCGSCPYSVWTEDYGWYCPFEDVVDAAEDRTKEVQSND